MLLSRLSDKMMRFTRRPLLVLPLIILHISAAAADSVTFEFITDIRNVSSFSFQVGEKSRQTVQLDLTNKRATTPKATTGVTQVIPGWNWTSARDQFDVTRMTFAENRISFTAKGQTASAVQIMPDIDYKFEVIVNPRQKKFWISGCHNEFPSYSILVNGHKAYDRVQTGNAFTGLIGVCDVVITEEGSF